MADPHRLEISADVDIVNARQRVRQLAAECGFSPGDQTVIAAAVSEVARNIVMYAKRGEIEFSAVQDTNRVGLRTVARDDGPGIRDVPRALQDGFSTSGGLGLGLPGAQRLMDEFDVASEPGHGTTVTMTKWTRAHG